MLKLPPLSLYVHIPWCVKKCPYCDFNSHVAKQTIPETDYVNALIEDLKADLHWVQGRKLRSIFLVVALLAYFPEQPLALLCKQLKI